MNTNLQIGTANKRFKSNLRVESSFPVQLECIERQLPEDSRHAPKRQFQVEGQDPCSPKGPAQSIFFRLCFSYPIPKKTNQSVNSSIDQVSPN